MQPDLLLSYPAVPWSALACPALWSLCGHRLVWSEEKGAVEAVAPVSCRQSGDDGPLAAAVPRNSGERISWWIGDATDIRADDSTYDAVFDFGIIHHIPNWRAALSEVHRVLKPGGRFYADEIYEKFLNYPLVRALLQHPKEDRFDHSRFACALEAAGLHVEASHDEGHFGFFVARKA